MRFLSTRGEAPAASVDDAILSGLAPDGGLYVPESLPRIISDWRRPPQDHYPEYCAAALASFFENSVLERALAEICRRAFTFDPALTGADEGRPARLELFHGPTAAFKDFGAQFLAQCLARNPPAPDDARPALVVTATSGDTGAAAAAALDRAPGLGAVILFPKGRVSEFQERQLSCWSPRILSLRVAGDFDDCQRIAKELFAHGALRRRFRLTSANSINIARILAQVPYFAQAAAQTFLAANAPANIIVPTGNLGNALACIWAREMGAPIGRIVLATNKNATIAEFFASGGYVPRASVRSLATAMDVGAPSNMERLRRLYPDLPQEAHGLAAFRATDEAISKTLETVYARSGEIVCPHTAAAYSAYYNIPLAEHKKPWIVAATAHPYKFRETLEPLLGVKIGPPAQLAEILNKSAHFQDIAPDAESAREMIENYFADVTL
ncbi:MAG: threonine synthase [Parvularculaceae bacterium]